MRRLRPILTMSRAYGKANPAGALALAGALVLVASAAWLPAQTAASGARVPAGSTLPANPPTWSKGGAMSQMAPLPGAAPTGNTAQHHRARVSYRDGMLEVQADNSSLNQILRDISHETGMKIVGGVQDQRVFGSYGPAPAATVLKTLLDGTGTNMLLQETATRAPKQLTLTPQTGPAIFPGPNSTSFDATESEPELGAVGAQPAIPGAASNPGAALGTPTARPVPAPGTALGPPAPASVPPSMPAPMNNPNGSPNNVSPTVSTLPVANSVPTDSLPTPSTAQPASGIVDAPNPPPAGSTTSGYTGGTPSDNNPNQPAASSGAEQNGTTNGQSPNGVKTPQQIYQQLQQLEQQKIREQQQQQTAPGSTQNPPSGASPQP